MISESNAWQSLDPKTPLLWRWYLGIIGFFSVLGWFAFDLVNLFKPGGLWFGVGPLTLLTLILVGGWLLPPVYYRRWRYRLSDAALWINRGVVVQVDSLVPFLRIQHMDVSQNMIERELDLARLLVYTAGVRDNVIVLPGLKRAEADRLLEVLRARVQDETL